MSRRRARAGGPEPRQLGFGFGDRPPRALRCLLCGDGRSPQALPSRAAALPVCPGCYAKLAAPGE